MDDGEEKEIKAGDSFRVEPGHDAWVVGNESCLMLDFEGGGEYAQPREEKEKAAERAASEEPQAWMQ